MSNPKHILIAGGVAGGMSCATRLRRLDETAKITVVEKGPYVSFANCGLPYALGGVVDSEAKLRLQTVEKMKSWFNIDAHINSELTQIHRETKEATVRDCATGQEQRISYDKLVLSMGAESFLPPIENIRSKNVFTLQTIPDLQKTQAMIQATNAQRAVIIGGGFIGLETAENFRKAGMDVTLFEVSEHVFPQIDGDFGQIVDDELSKNGVHLHVGSRVTKISPATESQPSEVHAEGIDPVPADIIIVAVGVHARTSIAKDAGLAVGRSGLTVNDFMQTSDPDIYAVGDMVETPHLVTGQPMPLALAGPANRQGRLVADHISGREVKYRGNLGTWVCQVFGVTVGAAGMSTSSLDRLGIKHEYVTVHPPQHVGWYPGSSPLTIKLAFEKPTGKILGAQVIGRDGVDKRVDVMATAMRAGMTVEDLEHLELGYAPPYGAAKDAINMAGFAASNVLHGDVDIIHSADLVHGRRKLEEFQIVDVRTPAEYSGGHMKHSINIPLANLRERIGELRSDVPVLAYCRVGYRGYVAARILKQHGFNVVNLDGGFKTVEEANFTSLAA